MAFGAGQLIEDTDYTTVYNKIAAVYGRNDDGYGQTMAANPAANNVTIYAAEWQNLRNYVLNSRVHQIGTAATLNAINTGDVINYANHLGAINTMADACVVGKRTIHSTQYSEEANQLTGTYNTATGNWGPVQRLSYSVQITGADMNGDGKERGLRYFFNSGGSMKFRFSLTGGSGPKFTDWSNLMANIGTITLNYNSISAGQGNQSAFTGGFDNIGTTQIEIYKRNTITGTVYSENYFNILAYRQPINGMIFFNFNWYDMDTGDQRGGVLPGPAVDEQVTGTMNSAIDQIRATGSYVQVASPSYAIINTGWVVL